MLSSRSPRPLPTALETGPETGPGTGPLIAVVGLTASGKSDWAMQIARRVDGEIVSIDSRQIYRRLDIGTAKPPADMRDAIPHWGGEIV
ncbi:MAG: tRNA (adenosine(37)-N6)-dimethylallyltransferase MiaA, partial [Chloroflexi bacterium]|nr:tRNA (adenosine(37)-N6)-dimethylallyltransferase MiaA [Chloroflexota bacterium]